MIISRKEALAAGLTRYFTGKPCKHGHVAERRMSNGTCCECERLKSRKHYAKNREKSLAWHRKFYSENREKFQYRSRKYYSKNREKCLSITRKCYSENREKYLSTCKKYKARQRDNIEDGYVRKLIVAQFKLQSSEITSDLIELKRILLQNSRKLKKIKEGTDVNS